MNSKMKFSDNTKARSGKGFGSGLTFRGRMVARLYGPDGNLKDERINDNLVTDLGHEMIIDQLLAAPAVGVPTHMALGTGTGQTASSTDLATPLSPRQPFDTKTRALKVLTMVRNFLAGESTGAITEAGVFNALSAGQMHLYNSFAVINKGAGDTLEITWTLTAS